MASVVFRCPQFTEEGILDGRCFGIMSQQFPTTAQVIYDTLTTDTVFMGLVGQYTFKSGQSYPSISVLSPGQDLPSLSTTTGVECIIHDVGNVTNYDYITNDKPRTSVQWSVFMVCWEPATGGDMQAATQRAMEHFLGSQSIQTVAVADGLGSMVQTKILIMSDMPIVAV